MNKTLSHILAGGLGLILGTVAVSLTGCQNAPVQAAGHALDNSYNLIRPAAETGYAVRAEDLDKTVGEFLSERNLTRLSADELDVVTLTLDEHQETIDALKTFGGDE